MKNVTKMITFQEFKGTRAMKMKLISTKSQKGKCTQHNTSSQLEKRPVMEKENCGLKRNIPSEGQENQQQDQKT